MLKKTHGLTLPLLRAVLTALPLLITQPGFAMPDTPSVPAPASVRVGFSPEGSATQLVLDTINNARYSIRMMAYSFTDPDVMKPTFRTSFRNKSGDIAPREHQQLSGEPDSASSPEAENQRCCTHVSH